MTRRRLTKGTRSRKLVVGSGEFFDFPEGVHDQAMEGCAWRLCWGLRRCRRCHGAGRPTPPTITIATPAEGAAFTQGTAGHRLLLVHRPERRRRLRGHRSPNGARSTRRRSATSPSRSTRHDTLGNPTTVTRNYSVVGRRRAPSAARRRPTLNLTLGAPAAFSPFIPGVAQRLHDDDDRDGHLDGGERDAVGRRPERDGTPATWSTARSPSPRRCRSAPDAAPSARRPTPGRPRRRLRRPDRAADLRRPARRRDRTLNFKQAIAETEALRTGGYAKTLTFTLSTTNP